MKNTMPNTIISVKIGAEAGQGVKSAGLMLAKLAIRSGYHIYNHIEYPSLIKGGHNVLQVNISKEEVTAPRKVNDILIALNQDTINKHVTEFAGEAGLIYDSEAKIDTSKVPSTVALIGVPLSKIAKEAGNSDLLINTVALGAVTAVLGGNLIILNGLISEEFGSKGDEVVKVNVTAAENGFKFVTENYKQHLKNSLSPLESLSNFVPYMAIDGNESVALGAISAGLQYAAIYPMSPISNILAVLAENQEKYGYIYKQPEDELSAINMAIGASYAGARAMTSTSGGGFCLMTEGYGLAGMTETPLVIIEGMRPGPATCLPTWSDQGDLQMILNAHQGDFPRIVLAAGDAKEVFELTMKAFNLADKYQTPVVLIIDKNICENAQSFPLYEYPEYKIDRGKLNMQKIEGYKRYASDPEGISQRTIPGVGNFFIANSDEHDEEGYSNEESDNRNRMMEKRMTKLKTCKEQDMEKPQLFGPESAEITIVSWGSNKGTITQALKSLENVNYVHINWMSPFPAEALTEMLSKSKYILNVECNYTGQMERLIRENTKININESFLKYDGRQIYPEEIIDKVNNIRSKK
ncbi:MAG: Pyruvate flavodoxin/ferredoxin oxidoreductase domain protein [candidate division WWE3 bacterium GW2011_GWF2_41_45]|uniref:Pyruvate flavodoxin/ferredoxin oxidoreductase domain protein n=3 Tax=Katanobacteria TaxID=422282 RepID=A0A0G0YS29_UNCKA|nr:MAG: Pyruvate flavodoxin/ferredoxin oxidoreductase domain protein [candidate division WWE3 bacterium GW2011_GWC2_41_23]KKS08934.1 MAG: Pyruvate flavodoxin/ferredoxin oxidoreductase domain protein [candidate division WWE3 bacterium GW2011_GWF2_41_45]KKS11838.1 MAG: Pyruvate flavodoxin/ferredoxin oxidoreductase domain protein [candidate division WWE3 bacterium GW2011_GWF1_41_53]KKS19502.1 MAG: Pyruvate flavodoxin/ferredoxin oxidoreductase domain protein [candidate division WWE3 bacterium GW2011